MFVTGTIVLERYKITKYLAGGGFANAYLAEDKVDGGKIVVVKECLATIGSLVPEDKEVIDRFRREAKLLMSIDSPHVVRYITDGIDGADTFIIVMEFAGDAVQNVLAKSCAGTLPPITEPVALSIIGQCVLGLRDSYAKDCHAHRDMDLKNAFLTDSGVVKVGDFGIAKIKRLSSITAGKIMGKFRHMAPECFTTPEKVDWLVDQYALGVDLVLLLSGRYPLDDPGDSIPAALKIVIEDLAKSPLDLKPGCCSDAISAVALKMLNKTKEDRYTTIEELFEALGGKSIIKRICPKCLSLNDWESITCSSCKISFEPEVKAVDKIISETSDDLTSTPIPASIDFSTTTAHLLITRRYGSEKEVKISESELEIGRKIIDPENRYVSRKHALIQRRSDGWFIEDMGSLNGTFVKATLLTEKIPKKLNNGDLIRFGDIAAIFTLDS